MAEINEITKLNEKETKSMGLIGKIPVELSIEVGSATLSVSEIFSLKEGDVLPLNRTVDDPFDVKVNGEVVGHGIVVKHDDQMYVKITKILEDAHHE